MRSVHALLPVLVLSWLLAFSCGSGGGSGDRSDSSGGNDDGPGNGSTPEPLIVRVSVDSSGVEVLFGSSSSPSASSEGRYTAFESLAGDLVVNDTNGLSDIFVHDRTTGLTSRVSVATGGIQANGPSYSPSISADGRYVAFESLAGNLVANDTNGLRDIFVHDRHAGSTTRVSVDSLGSQANNSSFAPSVSSDGRYIAFDSLAGNLVASDTNGLRDIFVHDRNDGTTIRVSLDSGGGQSVTGSSSATSISPDGRYIAFASLAGDLVAGDTNGISDIFLHDTITGSTTRVSVDSLGSQANNSSFAPSTSSAGRFIAFQSLAGNLVPNDTNGLSDIFVHDLTTGLTSRVSVATGGIQANGPSYSPSVSADGRSVAFESLAGNLTAGDTNGFSDIFIHDRTTGATVRASIGYTGNQADNSCTSPAISPEGEQIVFQSSAGNLLPDDTNGLQDIFVRTLQDL
ncbi:MAG: PD40 domain-containing protein [Nitrospiraceae bacterium]|nr:MAG: PD40 domain-containing protein [Nitrospiraceae bacterium]